MHCLHGAFLETQARKRFPEPTLVVVVVFCFFSGEKTLSVTHMIQLPETRHDHGHSNESFSRTQQALPWTKLFGSFGRHHFRGDCPPTRLEVVGDGK